MSDTHRIEGIIFQISTKDWKATPPKFDLQVALSGDQTALAEMLQHNRAPVRCVVEFQEALEYTPPPQPATEQP